MILRDPCEFVRRAGVGTEAVHAPPGRSSHPHDEALALDPSVCEKHETPGGKEIGFALEARRNLGASIAHRFKERAVDLAFAGARMKQIGEVKILGAAR